MRCWLTRPPRRPFSYPSGTPVNCLHMSTQTFTNYLDPALGQADPGAVVVRGDVRITVLTPTLLRLEHAPGRRFEDRPSLFAVRRRLPVPRYTVREEAGRLIVRTDRLELCYTLGSGPFARDNLSVEVMEQGNWEQGTGNRKRGARDQGSRDEGGEQRQQGAGSREQSSRDPGTGVRRDLGSGQWEQGTGGRERATAALPNIWRPGRADPLNLGGTISTLDNCKHRVPLGEGLLSRSGWYLLDDSHRPVFTQDWVAARESQAASEPEAAVSDSIVSPAAGSGGPVTTPPALPPSPAAPAGQGATAGQASSTSATPAPAQDWYFFGYGQDYKQALRDLIAVGGPIPLPPRYVFGSWYSRYWAYTAEDFIAIADEYHARGFPLDVMVLDMDWHNPGWTGYTWNRRLIPDPAGLLRALHERGLRVTMNLHPAEGVGPHEEAYPAFAAAMQAGDLGNDHGQAALAPATPDDRPSTIDHRQSPSVPFDAANPLFMRHYFELLHHPHERIGVDFWWIDWQQGDDSRIPGLTPLFWLNHQHFHDLQRPGTNRRGLTFSRWGGWGNHRYPIQFSGDTYAYWEVLRFLVHFTSTAGNVGCAYWSHDLGGHFAEGRADPELYVRWLQFGAFTAAMRVHSTNSPYNDRRPWLDGEPFASAARRAFDLRYRLLPYVYTMARKCYDEGLPLCRPMYLEHPAEPVAYRVPEQFYFGDDLIVAPALAPGVGEERICPVEVWLPAGVWYDLLTDQRFEGPGWFVVGAPLDHVPVFVRGGRPIPMARPGCLNTGETAESLHVRVYPGPDGYATLYEDDGLSNDYLSGGSRRTMITHGADASDALEVTLCPARGTYASASERRHVVIELPCTDRPKDVLINGDPAAAHQVRHDATRRLTVVDLGTVRVSETCRVTVS